MISLCQPLRRLLLGFCLSFVQAFTPVCIAAGPDPLPPALAPILDQTTDQGVALTIPLRISTGGTDAADLNVEAVADNTSLLPQGALTITRDGVAFALHAQPTSLQSGRTTVTVTVRDPHRGISTRQFTLIVNSFNQPPETTSISDQIIRENGATPALVFFIADLESPFESLVVTGQSSNPALVPATSFSFSGLSFQRSVVVRPAAGQSGEAVITLSVTDTGGQTTPIRFKLTVTPLNQKPILSAIQDVTQETTTGAAVAIPFTVEDAESRSEDLTVTASSSNGLFVPSGSITVGGEGKFRFIRFSPSLGLAGSTTITLAARDPQGASSSVSFQFSVLFDSPNAVPIDFNGDGFPDLVLEDSSGYLAAAFLKNRRLVGSSFFDPWFIGDRSWHLINAADFNGDREPDLLFQHANGTIAAWSMNGVKQSSVITFNPSRPNEEGWDLISVADLYADGTRDLVFQHRDGRLAAWLMSGTTLVNNALLNPSRVSDPAWRLKGTADLDGDRNPDLVFQHENGALGYWLMSGLRLIRAGLFEPSHPGSGWRVASLQDLDNDGKKDLLLQHEDGSLGVWYLEGTRLREANFLEPANPGRHWKVAGPR